MIRTYAVPADRQEENSSGTRIHLCDDCARERQPDGLSGELAGLAYFGTNDDTPSNASCRECATSVLDELPI